MTKVRNFIVLSLALIAFSTAGVNAGTVTDAKPKAAPTLEQQIYKKILALPNYSVFDHISFQINGGDVVLTGRVLSLGTRRLAASVVKDVPGVVNVVNNIEDLPPSSMDDSIRRQALRVFGNSGLGGYFWENRPDVRIIVENGHLTLEGYVMNRGDYNAMNIYANGLPGVFSVQNNLKIGKDTDR